MVSEKKKTQYLQATLLSLITRFEKLRFCAEGERALHLLFVKSLFQSEREHSYSREGPRLGLHTMLQRKARGSRLNFLLKYSLESERE